MLHHFPPKLQDFCGEPLWAMGVALSDNHRNLACRLERKGLALDIGPLR